MSSQKGWCCSDVPQEDWVMWTIDLILEKLFFHQWPYGDNYPVESIIPPQVPPKEKGNSFKRRASIFAIILTSSYIANVDMRYPSGKGLISTSLWTHSQRARMKLQEPKGQFANHGFRGLKRHQGCLFVPIFVDYCVYMDVAGCVKCPIKFIDQLILIWVGSQCSMKNQSSADPHSERGNCSTAERMRRLWCRIGQEKSWGAFMGILLRFLKRRIWFSFVYRTLWTKFGCGYANLVVMLTRSFCKSSPYTSTVTIARSSFRSTRRR